MKKFIAVIVKRNSIFNIQHSLFIIRAALLLAISLPFGEGWGGAASFAQVPAPDFDIFIYQAVARNVNGNLIANQNISLRFSIHDATAAGTIVYQETQSATTNALGLFTVNIGQGTPVTGTMAGLNWSVNNKFTQVEIDITGGTTYIDMGTQQIRSVPYAKYAETSGSGASNVPNGTATGQMLYWNGTAWVTIPPGTPGQFLQVNSLNIPTWTGGTYATLTTATLSSLSYYYNATSGGNITSDGITTSGGSPVTARGVCWSTSPNPTLANSKTSDGAGTGSFTSTLTGLSPATTYYVRAYAINSAGTAYGNQHNFTSVPAVLATLTTAVPSSITGGSAESGGTITDEGGTPVTARGICYSTSPTPTLANNFTGDGAGIGAFTSTLALSPFTTYYVRAYATNTTGTAYGNEHSFTSSFLAIGNSYQGGIIAYILQPGDAGYDAGTPHGLIAAPSDQSSGIQWYNGSYINTGATATAIGSGNANTSQIISAQGFGNYAAKLCSDLSLGGYNDWYLPSKNELNTLFINRAAVGGFNVDFYWTSSEFEAIASWYQAFGNGSQGHVNLKQNPFRVRAIRSF